MSKKPANPILALRPTYMVQQFSPYHFRINGRFDVWLPRYKWHNLHTGKRGYWNGKDLANFIKQQIGNVAPVKKSVASAGCSACGGNPLGRLCESCRSKSWFDLQGIMRAAKGAN